MYIDLYILVFFFSYSLFFSEGWLHGRRRWRNATGRRPPGRFSCPVAAPRIQNAPNPCSIFHFLLILNESTISHTTVSFASLHVYLNCMCWRISSIPLPITKTRTLRLISLHSLVCGVCIFPLCFPCGNPLLCFKWFKFTLKPPYSIVHDKLRLAIWDTSFWTFWLKFGHKGP